MTNSFTKLFDLLLNDLELGFFLFECPSEVSVVTVYICRVRLSHSRSVYSFDFDAIFTF
jgi:hypothetical protein